MKTPLKRDYDAEKKGWFGIMAILVIFPTLFFLCAFFPIWMGWTDPNP